jgi:hypothetical protein
MELTLGSETLTHFNEMPGLYPKENTLHLFLDCIHHPRIPYAALTQAVNTEGCFPEGKY